jgi:hypothetical protein
MSRTALEVGVATKTRVRSAVGRSRLQRFACFWLCGNPLEVLFAALVRLYDHHQREHLVYAVFR